MNDVVAPHKARLDFVPRAADLADTAAWREVWSARLRIVPGGSHLLGLGSELVLLNAPTGVAPLGLEPPSEERALAGGILFARPSAAGNAVLIDMHGAVHLWRPGRPPEKMWDTGAAGNEVDVVEVEPGRLSIQRPRGGVLRGVLRAVKAGWVIELCAPGAGGVLWHRNGDLRGVLPQGASLFVVHAEKSTVARLNTDDGQTRWGRDVGGRGVSELIALAGGRLWLSNHDNDIVGLDQDSGEVVARLRLPHETIPMGVVDKQGRYHVVTSTEYTVLDLADGARTVASTPLTAPHETQVSMTYGSSAILTVDGRLLFADRFGGIFAARAGQAKLAVLRKPTSRLYDFGVAHGRIYTVDIDGVLAMLGPAA